VLPQALGRAWKSLATGVVCTGLASSLALWTQSSPKGTGPSFVAQDIPDERIDALEDLSIL